MNPRVKRVKAAAHHRLHLVFSNGEEKIFDMTPLLDTGVFRALRDPAEFATVRAFLGSVIWRGGQDLCPDTLYEDSEPVSRRRPETLRTHSSRRKKPLSIPLPRDETRPQRRS